MNEKQVKTIIGGIFGTGTYTVWDEEGKAHTKKEKFNIRLYKDLWTSGAIRKLKGNLLGIFLTIAIHADSQGEGWPTQQTIADLLGISRDTVGKGLKKLEEYGFIEREKTRYQGKFDNTIYKIKFAPDLKDESEDHDQGNKRPKSERPKTMSENPTRQKSHKINVPTTSEKPTRKNRHGKTDTKDNPFSKDDLSFKDDPNNNKQAEGEKTKQQKKSDNDDVVVVVKEIEEVRRKVKETFNQTISTQSAQTLFKLLLKHNKKLDDVITNTKAYLDREGKTKNLIGALIHSIKFGWDVTDQPNQEGEKEDDQKKEETRKYYENLKLKALIALGIDPSKHGYGVDAR